MTDRLVAVVVWSGTTDLGAVWATPSGDLYALWPDGCADCVERDARGWLWDEWGERPYRLRDGTERLGHRLQVVSHSLRDVPPGAAPVTLEAS